MKQETPIIQQLAPTLAAALNGPFAAVAQRYIRDHLAPDSHAAGTSPEDAIRTLLGDAGNLSALKALDQPFRLEMQQLGVDVFALEQAAAAERAPRVSPRASPQIIISVLFLIAYFSMLGAIFAVEISDDMNMQTGDNSLMDQLQILFGVLTAGVVQILSYWFGGVLGKKTA
ncbi:hypothetical protein [Marinobacterium rhizophilum]|uniref:Uncharacterized protein n=1 Tax=Marinobacterium rhizophilum TaxID=420402 RepID=A0ABY5HHB7_9GAMM|nr:hypothetical protein [Marinobacterium rhizophilum]UTW11227.1 hypothetical protein KDW95_18435 [Marinobacterium rhizophilum]